MKFKKGYFLFIIKNFTISLIPQFGVGDFNNIEEILKLIKDSGSHPLRQQSAWRLKGLERFFRSFQSSKKLSFLGKRN